MFSFLVRHTVCSIELIKVFLMNERKLYVDIEIAIHVICVTAASMSVESVIESMVSIYKNRNNKFPISEEWAGEMSIDINAPDLAHFDSLIQLSMTEYWRNSGKNHNEDWHFVRRAQNIGNFSLSKSLTE